MKSIAILTGGGPAPGMNTVVASVAKTFLRDGYRVVGLVAAAALSLAGADSFGPIGFNRRFVTSVVIGLIVFILSWRYKKSPILLILASGLLGLIVY